MYSNNDYRYYKSDELYHHGILGQKWGRRRYQNEDGSLTDAGRSHYGYSGERATGEKKAGWRDSLNNGRGDSNNGGINHKTNYKQARNELVKKHKSTLGKLQKEYDTEISNIESKYKNGRSKITDDDYQKERDIEDKLRKEVDNENMRYQKDLQKLKDSHGKGNKLTKAIGKGLKEFGEEYTHDHSLEAEYERKKAEQDMRTNKIIRNAQRTKNAKGVSGKIDEFIGAGSKRTDYEEEAKYHDRMARTYKNKNLRKQHEIAAQNARIKADYEAERSKQYQKGGLNAAKQAGHDFIFGDSDRMSMKYITTSGRESTRGKEALRSAIFSTILDVAIDNVVGTPSSGDRNYVNAFSDNYKQAKERYRNK